MVKKAVTDSTHPAGGRKIAYEEIEVHEMWLGREGPIGGDLAKQILGWEDEPSWVARMVKENPKKKEEAFRYGDDYLLKDENGLKIRCGHNEGNRDFDDHHARSLSQDILNRNWAGPTTIPGGTVNGEAIQLSNTGRVISGQHRLIGEVLACQLWKGPQHDYWVGKGWETEPVLESLLVCGISEDPRVLMTLDNVKPRTEADVFFTSTLFQKMTRPERKTMSLMLARCVDLLWKRTRPDGKKGDGSEASFSPYRTHSEAVGFVERHKKHIIEALEHLFKCNKEGNVISTEHRLSPGQCAACMYLMGACASNGETYRDQEILSEKKLNWEHWDRATEFFTLLSTHALPTVSKALKDLTDSTEGLGGRLAEKLALLSRTWDLFRQRKKMEIARIQLDASCYKFDKNGVRKLTEKSDFGGIDLGEDGWDPESEKKDDPKEIEKRKKEAETERAKKFIAAVDKEREEEKNGATSPKDTRPDLAPNPKGTSGPRKPVAPKPLPQPIHKRTSEPVSAATTPAVGKGKKPVGIGGKAQTRKQVEAEQTRKAREADEEAERLRLAEEQQEEGEIDEEAENTEEGLSDEESEEVMSEESTEEEGTEDEEEGEEVEEEPASEEAE